LAFGIHGAEVELRIGIPLIRRQPIPTRRMDTALAANS